MDHDDILERIVAPVEPDAQREHWAIWAIIAVLASCLMIGQLTTADRELPIVPAVAAVAVVASLALRVRRPGLAVSIGFGATLAVHPIAWISDREVANLLEADLLALVLLWNAVRWMEGPIRVLALGAFAAFVAPAIEAFNPTWTLARTTENAVIFQVVVAVALIVRFTRRQRTERREAVSVEERIQLATDIHDSAAHHMSAIAIRAEAARTKTVAGTDVHQALTQIKTSASTALDDVRQLVGDLRGHSPRPAQLPGLGDIRSLCAQACGDRLTVYADLAVDESRVPVRTASTAYYIVREAITNCHRHAENATIVDVQAVESGDHIELTILDDGNAAAGTAPSTEARPQFGIVGMRERAEAIGGSLDAGPIRSGGWLVAAHLPLSES